MLLREAKKILEENNYLCEETSNDENVNKIVEELAEETGNDVDDCEIDERREYTIVSFGNEEYYVFEDSDKAEEFAMQLNRDLFDDVGMDIFNWNMLGGIEPYVDEDWFEEAFKEMADSYIGDLTIDEMLEEFDTDDEEEAKEKYLDNYNDDYVQAYIDVFGQKEFNEVVKRNNLIDIDKAAQEAIDTVGLGNVIASYDGEEIELSDGVLAYRIN